MTTSEDIRKRLLDLSDDQLFGIAAAGLDDREMRLLDEDFHGIALTGPDAVRVAERDRLPLVMAMRRTPLRAWEVPRDMNTILVAMDLDTRQVRFGRVFHNPKYEEYPPPGGYVKGPPPDPASAASAVAGLSHLDARPIVDLPWRSARYRFAVVCHDWISNTVDVVLEGSGPPQPGSRRDPTPLPPEQPTLGSRDGLPTYVAQGPADAGLVLDVAVNDAASGAALLAQGSFTTKADTIHLVGGTRWVDEVGGEPQRLCAVVPFTIAICALDSDVARHAEIAAPIYGTRNAEPGDAIEGHFRLDLWPELDKPPPAGAASVAWAFLDGRVYGPFAVR